MDPLGNRLPFIPPLQPPAPNTRQESEDNSSELVELFPPEPEFPLPESPWSETLFPLPELFPPLPESLPFLGPPRLEPSPPPLPESLPLPDSPRLALPPPVPEFPLPDCAFERIYRPNAQEVKGKRTKINYDNFSLENLFLFMEVLKQQLIIINLHFSRYLLSDHIITHSTAILQPLRGYSLSRYELRNLFSFLDLLINAENFEVLWLQIEKVIEKTIKDHPLEICNLDHVGHSVPNFLYHVATLHPQITLQKDLQDLLLAFLRQRNQASEKSRMYSYGIFAHFTDPKKFLELGKDFIIDTSKRNQDLPFIAETIFADIDSSLFRDQFIKIIHQELFHINALTFSLESEESDRESEESDRETLYEFFKGFSLFGPSIQIYLTEASKSLLRAILIKSIPDSPFEVIKLLVRCNLDLNDLQLSANFVDTLIETVMFRGTRYSCCGPFMNLAALFEKISLPLSRDYTQEINIILSNSFLPHGACETTILTLEALALLSRKKILSKLNDLNSEKIKSVFFNHKGELFPFSPTQKLRLSLALLELRKTNPTLPVLWFTAGLPRFIKQREDVGTKARFRTKRTNP